MSEKSKSIFGKLIDTADKTTHVFILIFLQVKIFRLMLFKKTKNQRK